MNCIVEMIKNGTMTTKITTHVDGGDSPLLSVGILTIPERGKIFNALIERLKIYLSASPVFAPYVEIISICSPKGTPTIGEKRNILTQAAKGEYFVMVDDDDTLFTEYFDRVIPILKRDMPDCIGYKVLCNFYKNGKHTKTETAIISLEYDGLEGNHHPDFNYAQGIYYKVPIRRELMLKEPFKDISYAEDQDFSLRIKKHVKVQSFIDAYLYHYIYSTTTGETKKQRYGIQ